MEAFRAHNLSHKRELSLEGFESRSFLFDFVYILLVLGFGHLGRFSGEGSNKTLFFSLPSHLVFFLTVAAVSLAFCLIVPFLFIPRSDPFTIVPDHCHAPPAISAPFPPSDPFHQQFAVSLKHLFFRLAPRRPGWRRLTSFIRFLPIASSLCSMSDERL